MTKARQSSYYAYYCVNIVFVRLCLFGIYSSCLVDRDRSIWTVVFYWLGNAWTTCAVPRYALSRVATPILAPYTPASLIDSIHAWNRCIRRIKSSLICRGLSVHQQLISCLVKSAGTIVINGCIVAAPMSNTPGCPSGVFLASRSPSQFLVGLAPMYLSRTSIASTSHSHIMYIAKKCSVRNI